ncbi:MULTISPECIES: hypothetical protein [unclassified Streptomyces]|uniref:hypothetical protein n=1 Tax=unclassified Streptomyces TaxID=2593676 RepID=UPI0033DFF6C9
MSDQQADIDRIKECSRALKRIHDTFAERGNPAEGFGVAEIGSQRILDATIPASLLVTLAPLRHPEPLPLEALAQRFADEGEGSVSLEELRSGPAVRVRRLMPQAGDEEGAEPRRNSLSVEYHLPVPATAAFLLLTFSTPLEAIADAMAGLFDAIADSLTWME